MNKLLKTLVVAGCACTVAASVAAIAGCGGNTEDKAVTGEAYALTHGAGYVGYATVTVKGDKIENCTLTEVCLPTYVVASETVGADDKVTVEVVDHGNTVEKSFYKTVKIGETTFTYDATAKAYQTGSTTLKAWLATEANCKAYYEAVTTNSIKVTVGGEEKTDIMNKAALSKEENGYWTRKDKDGNSYSRWKLNRDATVKYVIDNGVANLLNLVQAENATPDTKEEKDVKYWMDGEISTGATWSDLNSVKEGSTSYAQLIVNAYNATK